MTDTTHSAVGRLAARVREIAAMEVDTSLADDVALDGAEKRRILEIAADTIENQALATHSAVEAVARALSKRNDLHIGGPDAETLMGGKPNWTFRVADAEAAIAAMQLSETPAGVMLQTLPAGTAVTVPTCSSHGEIDGTSHPTPTIEQHHLAPAPEQGGVGFADAFADNLPGIAWQKLRANIRDGSCAVHSDCENWVAAAALRAAGALSTPPSGKSDG